MTTKGNHLTLNDRHYIEDALSENYSLIAISKHLGKDSTTISKEIKRNKVDRKTSHRIGRTYEDFNRFMEKHLEKHVVEMDTVHGTKGSKTLLTLFFRNSSLMLAFLIDACTQKEVKNVFDKLYKGLKSDVFQKTFPVILTDYAEKILCRILPKHR